MIKTVKKRMIALLCVVALLFAGQTEMKTVDAAGKVTVFQKFSKVKPNYNRKKNNAACNIISYKRKSYIYCEQYDKQTVYWKYPTTKAEKAIYGEKELEKTLFKGTPVCISGTSKSMIMETGEQENYKIKIKKGVKLIAIGSCTKKGHTKDGEAYCYGSTDGPFVKMTSASKSEISLKAVKKASEEWIPLQIYFSYKGQRYFYNYVLMNQLGKPIGWNVVDE